MVLDWRVWEKAEGGVGSGGKGSKHLRQLGGSRKLGRGGYGRLGKRTLPARGEKGGRERSAMFPQGLQLWGKSPDSPCSCKHPKNRSHNPRAPILSHQQSYNPTAPRPGASSFLARRSQPTGLHLSCEGGARVLAQTDLWLRARLSVKVQLLILLGSYLQGRGQGGR